MVVGDFTPRQMSDGNDFFAPATAPFPVNEVPRWRLPALSAQQIGLTQANVVMQCLRDELWQARQLVGQSGVRARVSSASSTATSRCDAGENPSQEQLPAAGEAATVSAYLSLEVASQRMSFVTDLTTRMQERARQRGRRSPNAAHSSEAGSRASMMAPTAAGEKEHGHHSRRHSAPSQWCSCGIEQPCRAGLRGPQLKPSPPPPEQQRQQQRPPCGVRRLSEHNSKSQRFSMVCVPRA